MIPRFEDIVSATLERWPGVSESDVFGTSLSREALEARRCIVYLTRLLIRHYSYPDIARLLLRRAHNSIRTIHMTSIRRMADDRDFAARVTAVESSLRMAMERADAAPRPTPQTQPATPSSRSSGVGGPAPVRRAA